MFYGADDGNRLVDENNYPESIKEYLKIEKDILISNIQSHDVIIEVGCMEARNLEQAIKNNKKYIGIDIVPEYIEIANKIVEERKLTSTCEFLCIDAERLDDVIEKSRLLKISNKPLFFFPFNSFGNMNNIENVIQSIQNIKGADFILFTYQTDDKSTNERFKYYNNCNYNNLKVSNEKNGIRFTADNGLNSMAYNEDFLKGFIKESGLDLEFKTFADIGIAYFISTREKEIEIEK